VKAQGGLYMRLFPLKECEIRLIAEMRLLPQHEMAAIMTAVRELVECHNSTASQHLPANVVSIHHPIK
jgi:hypothetical protein